MKGGANMNLNNNGCQQCGNGKFNCTDSFKAIDATCIPPSTPPEPSKLAYGSLYEPSGAITEIPTPVTQPALGPKVNFTTPGPLLNVAPAAIPNNNTDLQVAISGVYEISMSLTAELQNASDDPIDTFVRFGLFINDTFLVTESQFESDNSVGSSNSVVSVNINNTIGKTIQLRLNKDDRLSIRVVEARINLGFLAYNFQSLVVNKIDN